MKSQKCDPATHVFSLQLHVLAIVAVSFLALERRSTRAISDRTAASADSEQAPRQKLVPQTTAIQLAIVDASNWNSTGNLDQYSILHHRSRCPAQSTRLHPADMTDEWGSWPTAWPSESATRLEH